VLSWSAYQHGVHVEVLRQAQDDHQFARGQLSWVIAES
jgi:hypothetical protein